jgi:predicted RNA-binding protein with TRAM domain
MTKETMDTKTNESKQAPAKRRTLWVALICVAALIGVLYLILGSRQPSREATEEIVVSRTDEAPSFNFAHVIDATGDEEIEIQEGARYRVVIEDESRDGVAGVAFIGGMVTFVDGTRPGDVVVVEVTRLKRSVAEAIVVERISEGRSQRKRAERPRDDTRLPQDTVYHGKVTDMGSKGDGIVRVNNKVVFVPDTEVGDEISFRIREDKGNFAIGERVDEQKEVEQETESDDPADAVQPGATFDVTVTEKDRKNPDTDGVARIGGLVVFVPGTQPGDEVSIRITGRRPRFAFSEVIDEPAETASQDDGSSSDN